MEERRQFTDILFKETSNTLSAASDLLLDPISQRASEVGSMVLRHALTKLRISKAGISGRRLLGI